MRSHVADHIPALLPLLQRHARRLVRRHGLTVSPDDLVNDVAVIALRAAERFDGRNLAGWLTAILQMRARDVGRRMRSRRRFEGAVPGAADDGPGGAGELPDVAVEAHQLAELECRQVLAILAGMDAAARDIIRLAVLDGHSSEEVAQHLALPLGTVRSRLSRALGELRARCEGTTTFKRGARGAAGFVRSGPGRGRYINRDLDAGRAA